MQLGGVPSKPASQTAGSGFAEVAAGRALTVVVLWASHSPPTGSSRLPIRSQVA